MLLRTFFVPVALLGMTLSAQAAEQESSGRRHDPTASVIHVTDLHCPSCAKRLARKLYAVPGVKLVKANVDEDYVMAIPETEKTLPVVKLWEATEAAKFQVVKIETPAGTYDEKPADVASSSGSSSNR